MVERGVAWIVAGGNGKVRYRGVIRNNAWLNLRAAALNLRRLENLGLTVTDGAWTLASTPCTAASQDAERPYPGHTTLRPGPQATPTAGAAS